MRWWLGFGIVALALAPTIRQDAVAQPAAAVPAGLAAARPAAVPQAAATSYRFKVPSGPAPVGIGPAVLTPEERAFLARLPEVRVALARAGAPPYERVAADGEISGLQPELLGYLARAFGLRIRPVVFPDWPSTLRSVRDGQADMILTLSVTRERREHLAFTLGTVSVPIAVIRRAGEADTPLERARVAIEREYYSRDYVQARYPQASIVPVDSTLEALRRVASREADAYLGSLLEVLDLLARERIDGLVVQQIVTSGAGQYHFGVRRDWAPLATILSKGITSYRVEPSAAAVAALRGAAGIAPDFRWPTPLPLAPDESLALAERSVWRVGAVRGLTLLNSVDERGVHSGVAADFLEQVALRLGVSVELATFDSVSDMLLALRDGRIDLVPFLTRTAERAREFGFSAAYFEMPYVLVGRSDGPLYWDLASLRGRRLALAPAHPLRELVAAQYPQIVVLDPRDGNEALDMVARGDADAAVEVKLFANLRINAEPTGRLRSLGDVRELPAQFHFATSGAAAGLVPLIDRALADIPPVERERMIRRWVAVDLVPAFHWQRFLPEIVVGGVALAVLAGLWAWWSRRTAREVRRRRRADEQLQDIARTLPGLVFRYVLDADQRLVRTWFSPGAEGFLGVPLQPGKTLVEMLAPGLTPEHREAAFEAQRESMRTGQPFRYLAPVRDAQGRLRWLHGESVRSTTREGLTAWTGYVIDETSEQELRERVTREARERHLMLASASHELRAPTHTLALALQSVDDAGLPAAASAGLRIARDSAATLRRLLDDVLDAARLDAGRLQLRPFDFDLPALIQQLVEAYDREAAGKGLRFEHEVAPDVPRLFRGDALRLRQVLVNLLSNAVRYTAHGSIRFDVRRSVGTDGAALEFVVTDTGVGIPEPDRARLFEPFATLRAGATESPSGSGLGLSISRRLVHLMGGSITLDSRPAEAGGGVRATVTLPLPAHPSARALRPAGALLLCDDDDVSRLLMAQMLRQLGHQVVAVPDVAQALDRWREGDVRVVVTDLTMPGADGHALVQSIRLAEAESPWRTAILVCSGTPPPVEDGQVRQYDAYLPKPVDLATLTAAFESLGAGFAAGPADHAPA
jgi:two-component system sensor histidine kinase EvgS